MPICTLVSGLILCDGLFLFPSGKRCMEMFSICAAAVLNCYVVYMLVKHFQPWDSIWIAISVCKC